MNPSDTPPPPNPSAPTAAVANPGLPPSPSETTTATNEDGNFVAALAAGFVAAIAGAATWAAITAVTKYQIGWIAVGVGFLVGFTIRTVGKGSAPRFATAGAALALFGCVLGNLLTVVGTAAEQGSVGFFFLLGKLTPSLAVEFLKISFEPIDLLFYGIAVYEGFKVSRLKA